MWPSLRAYGAVRAICSTSVKRLGSGLTFAPEAGTQRMRDVINKNVSDDDILASARRIFSRGYDRMKMYFIIGLPTETDEDVVGIVQTGARVRAVARELGLPRMPTVTVSVSQHVPKPHTPFQWAAMDGMAELEGKVADAARRCASASGSCSRPTTCARAGSSACSRAAIAALADVLEHAYRAGARFDGWQEHLRARRWLDALAACGVEPDTLHAHAAGRRPAAVGPPRHRARAGLPRRRVPQGARRAARAPRAASRSATRSTTATSRPRQADARRLVCYDCGIACDMTQMRGERLVALRR